MQFHSFFFLHVCVSMKEETPDTEVGKKGKVVVYTTSIKAVRETSENCRRVLHTLQAHRIDFTVKDVNLHPDYSKELSERLQGSSFTLPQVMKISRVYEVYKVSLFSDALIVISIYMACVHYNKQVDLPGE